MTDIATLSVKVTTSGIQIANDQLDKLGRTASTTETKTTKLGGAVNKVGSAFRGLSGILAGLGISAAARAISDATDRFASMQGQLKLVTSSQAELNAVYQRALSLANETGRSVEATVNLYARMARSTEELNLTQDQLFTVTKAINQSFIVSGASAQEASAGILQLSQGMASGVLRGEELNSVMENSPRLARALADGLGIGIGQLRKMGSEGQLTGERVVTALTNMADSINDDFTKMPITIGRVMQEIKNDFLDSIGGMDTGPAVEAMEDLRDALADPEIKTGLRDLAAGILNASTSLLAIVSAAPRAAAALGEFFAKAAGFSGGSDTVQGLIDEYADLSKKIEFYTKNGHTSSLGVKDLIEKQEQLRVGLEITGQKLAFINGKWQLLDATLNKVTVTAKEWEGVATKGNKTIDAGVKSVEKLNKVYTDHLKANKALGKYHKDNAEAYIKAEEALEDYIEDQEFQLELIGKTAREQAIMNSVRSAGIDVTKQLTAAEERASVVIRDHAAAIYDQNEAAAQSKAASEKMIQAWGDARTTLSGFFFEFAKDGQDAFDTIVSSFKAMIAKLIAEAAANTIFLSIAAGASGLGFSGAASAATSAATSGGGGILSGLGSSAASYFMQNSSLFTNQGLQFAVPGDGGAALGPQFSGMGALQTAGAGLLGGFAGNAIFGGGGYSNIGATIGGLGGSMFGPLGAGIGSFLGSGLGSLLGGDNSGNNSAKGTINLGTGATSVSGVGKSFEQANVDALESLAPSLQALAAALGGSDAILNIRAGNNSGLSLNGQSFGKDEAGFIAAAIEAMVDGSTVLSKTLKSLIQNFEGSSEEIIAFAESMVSIDRLIQDNPVDKAIQDFTRAQEVAGSTLQASYNRQLWDIEQLTAGFDGSARAAVELNAVLSANKQLAYDMALGIQALGDSTKDSVQSQLEYFTEQTRTPDENLQVWEAQFDRLFERLPNVTDPEGIANVTDRLLELNRMIFDAGPEDLQRANRATFIDAAQTIGEMSQTALDASLANLQTSQEAINAKTNTMMEATASSLEASASTMQEAANILYQASLNYNRSGGYSEVTA